MNNPVVKKKKNSKVNGKMKIIAIVILVSAVITAALIAVPFGEHSRLSTQKEIAAQEAFAKELVRAQKQYEVRISTLTEKAAGNPIPE